MNKLAKECQEIMAFLREHNLDIDVYQENRQGTRGEPVRAYITSKPLGGLLAQSHSDGGWFACFPEKPNYPIKGRWSTAPARPGGQYRDWRKAVIVALTPWNHIGGIGGRLITMDRALQLRDRFRAEAVAAILKGGGSCSSD